MERGCGSRLLRLWAALLLAVLSVPLGPADLAAAEAPGETGRYYIVRPPVDGQREYLYDIALRTLGNGNRFREIIELNKGRKQPDGATFTDGVELGPGWILVLPRDARGEGVRAGALPPIGAQSARPRPSTAAPRSSAATPQGSPSPTATRPPSRSPATSPPAVDPAATVAAGSPPTTEPHRLATFGRVLTWGGAGVLAVLLGLGLLTIVRRSLHRMRPVPVENGPWPPQRHHTPTPAELGMLAAAGARVPPVPPLAAEQWMSEPLLSELSMMEPGLAEHQLAAHGLEEPVMAEQRLADLRTTELTQLHTADLRTTAPVATPPAPHWPPALTAWPTPEPFTPPSPGLNGTEAAGVPWDTSDLPRPALPADDDVPYVRADMVSEVGPILVRLAGVATGPTTPPYAWLAQTELAPAASVPLVLGGKGPWRFHVDLGRTPDVFTLVGAAEDCRRLAAGYARQLHAGGVAVAVVGDALGPELFDGCQSLAAIPEPDALPADPCVVITAGLAEGAGAEMRGLVAATRGRCVPMVIGQVADSRWSAQIGLDD
ncbi:hypothetical protein GCM10022251_75560 [Phytohabitans flavus]|uniref:LysM domain-containing protein n=1 Tax=Phytohabitans flavus TaxID=1076124 RepID=A0A6F8XMI0_9ACTN|nr:hypothetical protein [Phytohabitans flavus]BCB74991.1 hypothetical protein Pflav_014010 [Phytohabitans flavus]